VARDPFVCSVQANRHGLALQRAALRRRFLSACKVLGLARLRTLTIHHGRHTFISHALAGGRTITEVRAAAGHASLLTTSVYLHVAVDDDGEVGTLFAKKAGASTSEKRGDSDCLLGSTAARLNASCRATHQVTGRRLVSGIGRIFVARYDLSLAMSRRRLV